MKKHVLALLSLACFGVVLAACGPNRGEPTSGTGQSEPTEQEVAMTVREQAGAVLMIHVPGTEAVSIDAVLNEVGPAGLILMGDNIPETEQDLVAMTSLWQEGRDLPLLVAIDQEGGVVSRLDSDPSPGAEQLRDGDPAQIERAFRARSLRLHELGINVNFGVVADVAEAPDSFIFQRVLGSTTDSASEGVAAAVRGEKGHVFTAIKHFPDHGAAPGDSHEIIPESPMSRQQWDESSRLPFQAGIDAGAEMVMTGHLRFTAIDSHPASLSSEWTRILREEMGFDGVIVTDSILMLEENEEYSDPGANAVAALKAGASLVLDVGGNSVEEAKERALRMIDRIVAAVDSGELPAETLHDAARRVVALRESVNSSLKS